MICVGLVIIAPLAVIVGGTSGKCFTDCEVVTELGRKPATGNRTDAQFDLISIRGAGDRIRSWDVMIMDCEIFSRHEVEWFRSVEPYPNEGRERTFVAFLQLDKFRLGIAA